VTTRLALWRAKKHLKAQDKRARRRDVERDIRDIVAWQTGLDTAPEEAHINLVMALYGFNECGLCGEFRLRHHGKDKRHLRLYGGTY